MSQARGKVLFIDEAYQLNPEVGGSYMREAVDEIVKCLTSSELRGKLVVILAGYESDIDKMLRVNQGLQSRFAKRVHFHDLSASAMQQLLLAKLPQQLRDMLTHSALASLPSLCAKLKDVPGFSNGRDVETWSRALVRHTAARRLRAIEAADLAAALESMLQSRPKPVVDLLPAAPVAMPRPALRYATVHAAPLPAPVLQTHIDTEKAQPKPQPAAPPAADFQPQTDLFSSVPPTALSELQKLLQLTYLDNEEGIKQILSGGQNGPLADMLVHQLAASMRIAPDYARQIMQQWLSAQQKLEDLQKEVKKRKLRPIWRCRVCGRADMPFIACYVAPFIVRYDETD